MNVIRKLIKWLRSYRINIEESINAYSNKILFLVITFILAMHATGQTIELMEDKVTQLIFPAPVKTIKGGFIPDDFIYEKQENVLYIQPVASFPESNLNVITDDGLYYTFTIKYNQSTQIFNHIIGEEQAIYGQKKKQETESDETKTEEQSNTIASRVMAEPGTLFSRNAIRYKKTYMYLKGVYINQDKLYLRLLFENKSNIQYDFEYIAFYIKEKKQRKNATQEQVQMIPESIYKESKVIPANGETEMLYSFPKFTIGKDKILCIDMIEKGGERNLSLQLDNSILLNAKEIK